MGYASEVFASPLQRVTRGAWRGIAILGVASLLLGIAVLAWPRATLAIIGGLFGLYLAISGVMQLVAGIGGYMSPSTRLLSLISGTLSIVLAVFCFRSMLQSILLLAIWIGVGWLFRGISQLASAASDPGVAGRGWQTMAGLISVAAGLLLMFIPVDSVGMLAVLAGWWFIVMGIVELVTAMKVRAAVS